MFSHLSLAHDYWRRIITPGDTVVDATCGNGKDTLVLAQLVGTGTVWAIDIQDRAIRQTKNTLSGLPTTIHYRHSSHRTFPEEIEEGSIKLIAYNLGYLPGGDKTLTTQTEYTLESLRHALPLIAPSGAISVTCYPGHKEGEREEKAILQWAQTLPPSEWMVCHHCWLNRKKSPSLLLLTPT